MFEIEDIYEFVDKEAFPSLDEFKTYANSGSAADIYEFVDKGAFATLDEFTSLLKKKDEPGVSPTKDEGEDTSSVSDTAPKVDGLSAVSVLTKEEEAEFQQWMKTNPDVVAWREQFVRELGEEPRIDGGGFDYRGAWKAGIAPKPNPQHKTKTGEDAYHWPSIGEGGKDLKSKDHPTRWKSDYMKKTGINPDDSGISKEDALKVIEEEVAEEKPATPQYTEEKAEETKGDISSLRSRWENTMKSIRDLYTVEKEKIMSAEPETIEELGEKQGGEKWGDEDLSGEHITSAKDIPLDGVVGAFLLGQEEEEVVPILQKMYGIYGFKFEEAGPTAQIVVRPKKEGAKAQVFNVDQMFDFQDKKEAEKLRAFLKENASEPIRGDITKVLEAAKAKDREAFAQIYDQTLIDDEKAAVLSQVEQLRIDQGTIEQINKNFAEQNADIEIRFEEAK